MRDVLRRKRRDLDDFTCVLCSANQDKTLSHLFFDCSFSKWCWWFLKISWSHLDSYLDIVDGRRNFGCHIFREIFIICC
jgi:hypothetical protein